MDIGQWQNNTNNNFNYVIGNQFNFITKYEL